MQTIGVLGGFGPQVTMDFEARVHQISQRLIPQRANQGYPPLLTYYHRHAPVITDDAGTTLRPTQADPRLLDAARQRGTWADFLVIISNGAHVLEQQIEQAAGRKVLSMMEATMAEVKRRRMSRVGVLGLFKPRVYQVALAQGGIACETIADDLQQHLDQAIFAVMGGRADQTRAMARAVPQPLRAERRSYYSWLHGNPVHAAGGGERAELDQSNAITRGHRRADGDGGALER